MFTWVKEKKACTVFYAPKGSAPAVINAMKEVSRSVAMISGGEIPCQEISVDKITALRGATVFSTFQALPFAKQTFATDYENLLGTDGFAIREKDGNLYILSHTAGGVFFGAHDLLEKNAEIIWTRAKYGEDTSFIPNENVLLTQYDYAENPYFLSRGWNICGFGEQGAHKDLASMIYYAKNKNNTKFEVYDEIYADYGVSVQGLFVKGLYDFSEYMESNPEYFMVDFNGKPRKNRGSLSFINYYNQEIAKIYADRIIDLFRKQPNRSKQRLYFGMPDDHYFIMKAGERILNQEPFTADDGITVYPEDKAYKSTVWYNFLNRVVKLVCAEYPEARFLTLAYLYAEPCPKTHIDERIAVGIAPIGTNEHIAYVEDSSSSTASIIENIKAWSKKVPDVFVYAYWESLTSIYPRPLCKVEQKNLRFFQELGIRHLIPEGYLDESNAKGKDDKFDANELYIWLLNKLMWNPDTDLDALTERFCRLVYGEAKAEMIEFYRLIQKGWDESDAFVFCATGNDVYIKQLIIKAGVADGVIAALENGLSKNLTPSQARRIRSMYDILKPLIERFSAIGDEDAVATYCNLGRDKILSQEMLAMEENTESAWNKTSKLSVFKNYSTLEDYAKEAGFNVRLLWDEKYIYIAFQVFDNKLTDEKPIWNKEGLPVVFRSDGTQISSYTETYIGGNVLNTAEYYGYITGIFLNPADQGFYLNDGAPKKIPMPKDFKESFYFHYDQDPKKRYYVHVQAISFEDLDIDVANARPYGSFVYYTNRYDRVGWKGNGLWSKQNFEEFQLKKGE